MCVTAAKRLLDDRLQSPRKQGLGCACTTSFFCWPSAELGVLDYGSVKIGSSFVSGESL